MTRIKLKTNGNVTMRVNAGPNTSPAAVKLHGGDGVTYEFEGDFDFELVQEPFVDVELISSLRKSGAWTYLDPYGDLVVGDVVKVPFGSANSLRTGRVIAVDVPLPAFLSRDQVKTVAARARFEDE